MLTLTPNQAIYFLVNENGTGKVKSSVSFIVSSTGYITLRIMDDKVNAGAFREVELKSKDLSARVNVHDSDRNHTVYINWYEDSGEIGIDASKDVLVLREKLLTKCNGAPIWKDWIK